MPPVLTLARCPNCGAPVNAPPGASHVICVYCNESLLVAQQPGTEQASLKVEGLPPLEVARVKDLLLDGKRDQAIAHYMRLASIILWLFLALPIVLFFFRIAAFYRHARATWTAAFGSKGNAKVLRCGVLREVNADAFHTVCHFEVTPADGGETFQDQEVLYVGAETLKKLQPGNIVNVRYDGSRQHVYIQMPVIVLSTGA
jgi:hypothetical protein